MIWSFTWRFVFIAAVLTWLSARIVGFFILKFGGGPMAAFEAGPYVTGVSLVVAAYAAMGLMPSKPAKT